MDEQTDKTAIALKAVAAFALKKLTIKEVRLPDLRYFFLLQVTQSKSNLAHLTSA